MNVSDSLWRNNAFELVEKKLFTPAIQGTMLTLILCKYEKPHGRFEYYRFLVFLSILCIVFARV